MRGGYGRFVKTRLVLIGICIGVLSYLALCEPRLDDLLQEKPQTFEFRTGQICHDLLDGVSLCGIDETWTKEYESQIIVALEIFWDSGVNVAVLEKKFAKHPKQRYSVATFSNGPKRVRHVRKCGSYSCLYEERFTHEDKLLSVAFEIITQDHLFIFEHSPKLVKSDHDPTPFVPVYPDHFMAFKKHIFMNGEPVEKYFE